MTLTTNKDNTVSICFTDDESEAARNKKIQYRIWKPETSIPTEWMLLTGISKDGKEADIEKTLPGKDSNFVYEVRCPSKNDESVYITEYQNAVCLDSAEKIKIKYRISKKLFSQMYTIEFSIQLGKKIDGSYLKTDRGFPFCGIIEDGTCFQCSIEPKEITVDACMAPIAEIIK